MKQNSIRNQIANQLCLQKMREEPFETRLWWEQILQDMRLFSYSRTQQNLYRCPTSKRNSPKTDRVCPNRQYSDKTGCWKPPTKNCTSARIRGPFRTWKKICWDHKASHRKLDLELRIWQRAKARRNTTSTIQRQKAGRSPSRKNPLKRTRRLLFHLRHMRFQIQKSDL